MARMTWKKWRIGLALACVFGLLNAGAGLLGDMGWKSFIAVLCASLLTNLMSYLTKHPLEDVEDTVFFNRPPASSDFGNPPPPPPSLGLLLALLLPVVLLLPGCALEFGKRGLRATPVTPPKDALVGVSGSSIGIHVGQNQTTQTPEFDIGYRRWTYYRVPTGTTNIPAFRAGVDVSKEGFDAGIVEMFQTGDGVEQEQAGGSALPGPVIHRESSPLNLLRQ